MAKKTTKDVAKSYERSEEDAAYLADFKARKAIKRGVPKHTLELTGNTASIEFKRDNELDYALFCDALGSTDEHFIELLPNSWTDLTAN